MTTNNQLLWAALILMTTSSKTLLGQITVQSNKTALELAQAITGNGVIVSNATLTCANQSNGIFNSPNTAIGLDGGIVLSTGNANNISNPEPGVISNNMNRSGDVGLTALSNSNNTYDACVLEFDVIPNGDELKFEYVFASEEYINSVCGPYNDIFAFFISGPGITGQKNMALVPNTQIPVAVNSVNNGIVGSNTGCNLTNCTSLGWGAPFTQYYNNNSNGRSFAFRGYTHVFTARQYVTPCTTYHLKLAIADAGNAWYDSGVLIKSGSLSAATITPTLSAPLAANGIPTAVKGCSNANITFTRPQSKPTAQTIYLQYGGNALPGTDYTMLPDTITIPANGTTAGFDINSIVTSNSSDKTLIIYVLDPNSCNSTPGIIDSVSLLLIEQPTVDLLTDDTEVCPGTDVQIATLASRPVFEYHWTPSANINNSSIANPIITPVQSTTYMLEAVIPNSGCPVIKDSVRLTVIPGIKEIVFSTDSAYNCEGKSIQVDIQLIPQLDNVSYTWSGAQGYTSSASGLNLYSLQKTQEGWYILTATTPQCGSVTDSVYINVITDVPSPRVVSKIQVCQGEVVELHAQGTNIKWYEHAIGGSPLIAAPVIQSDELGDFTLYVSQSYGSNCESNRVPIVASIMKCCQKDMFLPNAFTPNNDGLNDELVISFDNSSRLLTFEVFNRWGASVYKASGSNVQWDGSIRGVMAEEGVYFYYMEVQCTDGSNVIRKGEISLLR